MKIAGQHLSRRDAERITGNLSQLCDIKLSTLMQGREKGVKVAEVRTGSGLDFTVIIDRCMDIGRASYRGTNLSWLSQTGYVHPSYYEPEGGGWLTGFFGGLLTTCGLSNVGAPCTDRGEALGQHGRISYQPAEGINIRKYFKGEEYFIELSGTVREVSALGRNLKLSRKLTVKAGESRIRLDDEVENCGTSETPFMLLYHFNLGFPLLSKDTVLVAPSTKVIPRDKIAEEGLQDHNRFSLPLENYAEKVYYHELKPGKNGLVEVKLVNKRLKNSFMLRYNIKQLPKLVQWKQMNEKAYVCGLEPANCWVEGRAKERERGTLKFLRPGEKNKFSLELEAR